MPNIEDLSKEVKNLKEKVNNLQNDIEKEDRLTIVVFSNDFDKVMANLIIATGAAAMGTEVTMFYTFWGLSILRKKKSKSKGRSILEKMFGLMLPKGTKKLSLSKMNFAGMGPKMMRYLMKEKNISQLEDLLEMAIDMGIKMQLCQTSMEVMGMKKEDFIKDFEVVGVASFLNLAYKSKLTLFI